MTVGLSWPQVIALVAGSSVLAAVLTQLATALQDHWRRSRAASYLAIRIATTLEEFAEACMSVITDFDTYRQSSGAAGGRTTRLPQLGGFPDDTEGWRAVPAGLTARALTFPNHVRAGQERVDFTWSVADEHATWDDCQEECAKLGLSAWELAGEMRRAFKFPAFQPRYDVEGALRREVKRWDEP